MKQERNITYRDVIRFALHYWGKRPLAGILLVTLMIGGVVVDSFVPVYTGLIVDALTGNVVNQGEALNTALTYLAIFMALAFMHSILRTGAVMIWAWFAVRCLYEILTDGMKKVQRFSTDWHANAFAGATVRKITRGMWSFDLFGDTLLMGLLPAFVMMMAMTAILIYHLPLVGFFTLGMIMLYNVTSVVLSIKLLAPRFRASAASDTKVGATLADIMTGNPTVKAFGAESREEAFFDKVATNWRRLAQRAWLTSETINLLRSSLRLIMLGGMVGLTIYLWNKGLATPGDIALSLTSFFIIGGYMRDIGMHIAHLQKAVSEMEDAITFWLREDEIRDKADAVPFKPGKGEIIFDKVTFAYNDGDNPVYKDFSVHIKPGEKVALVGHSGSGKSTFVKLVQRLYDVQDGAIRIDGQVVADVRQESLRHAIALVPQDPILFHRSLAANIAYGRPDASMDEIMEAAIKARAHDFIQDLQLGYDTLVGERGIKLSGGERQRVAIARSILADAPILILDEATSSLDSVSEHHIQAALDELIKDRTTIIVAHRLATIRAVDRILVFDKGRIVEQGTHDQLIRRKGSKYKTLYEMQALSLIDENILIERAAE